MSHQKRRLGDRLVTPIGLGCMSLSWAYGKQPPDATGKAILHRALDLGYDHLDTARIYGDGHNEQLLGEALQGLRHHVFLASKGGLIGKERRVDCRPETLRAAVEESLRALRTDHIDLYYMHRRDFVTPIEESVHCLADLIQEGKIGAIGLSEVSADTLRRASAVHPIAAVQNEYSLWTRNPEIAVLDACRELGTTLVAFSPLGRGALTGALQEVIDFGKGDFRSGMPRFQTENWAANQSLIAQFVALARHEGVTPAQLALAWVLSRGDHVIAIPGSGQMAHVEENIARWDWQPSPSTLEKAAALINQDSVHGDRYGSAMKATIDSEDFQ